MDQILADPDVKINMSLDEIITLTRGQMNDRQLRRKHRKRWKRHAKKTEDHSVPLLSTTSGVDIYVSKKSSLLNAEHRRRIIQAVSNRGINSELLQKTKEIIPAEYKLVKTNTGVERVLVPAPEYFEKVHQKRVSQAEKQNNNNEMTGPSYSLPDKPPPLMSVPIYDPPCAPVKEMEVDKSDDEVEVLVTPKEEKRMEVIDVECNLPVDVMEARKMCISAPDMTNQYMRKTLSDRFTMLTGTLQF